MEAGSDEFMCPLSCPVSRRNAPAARWKQQKLSEWVYDLQKTIDCVSLNMKKMSVRCFQSYTGQKVFAHHHILF